MKHLLNFTLLLLAILLPATAIAHDFEVNGIYYNKNGNKATVTFKGTSSWNHNTYYGNVIIPSTVTYNGTTYSVTTIGEGAFSGCSGLTSVNIPNSVTTIGYEAFYGCTGLTSISIPNSVTLIAHEAFFDCTGLTSISIPNSVISIGGGAFSGCSGLTSIMVENCNSEYDSRNGCNAIIETASNNLIVGCKNTVIPNSVTTIGDEAYFGCTGLTSVNIPYSVTSIGSSAFSRCIGLTSVTIPNSVISIGDGAFCGCRNLTSMTIPNSVTSIGGGAFSDTPWYNNQPDGLVYAGPVAYCYKGTVPEGVIITIRKGTLGIAGAAFAYSGLTSVTIPNSITNIGNFAFEGCRGLKDVYCYIVNPSAVIVNREVFYVDGYPQDYSYRTLYVPIGSVAAYQADSRWSAYFGSIVEMAPAPGDVDADGRITVADAVKLIDLILGGGASVVDYPAADVNGNGVINLGDVVDLIDQLLN